ncbi:MAG TPA: GGDEF domain-containing protein [Acidimicrobiales bacterium]|nr:GGDEF domain-containing protein [Acidimicrobiales bacterium]
MNRLRGVALPAARSATRVHGGVDMAPLHLRLLLLQVLRVALAGIAAVTALVLPGPLGVGRGAGVVALCVTYAVTSTALELARRRFALRSAALVGGLILFDGAFLAVVMGLTGGPQSVLSFLVLVHVIAVTLLLSFRNGLKAALWHALLLFVLSWLFEAGVVSARPGVTPEQSAVLGALALLIVAVATAWFSSLNEGELRRGKAEMRALADMGSRMAATRDRAELLQALLDGVARAFGHQRAAVVLLDTPTLHPASLDTVTHATASGDGAAPGATSGATPLAPVIGPAIAHAGAPPAASTATAFVLAGDGRAAPAATGPAAGSHAGRPAADGGGAGAARPLLVRRLDDGSDRLLATALPGASNVIVAPLVIEGRAVGAVAVERAGGRRARVTARTVELLGQFAAHAALALRAAALQAEVERMASTDALTGVANRRSFESALRRELARATRRGESCGLIVLDVDHFKRVNDTYGHQAGDEVLARVGQALGDAARATDIVARYGGEEFAVILPSSTGADAVRVAERLRAAVGENRGPVAVTVSAGAAVFPVDGSDASALVAAADAALYKAKRQGRDRTVRFRRPRPLRVAAAS